MLFTLEDTIAAVSSPPGGGARGIVRVSGPRAPDIAAALFHDDDPTPPAERGGFRRFDGEVEVTPGGTVPAELYVFRAPRSYTRDDLVEFHTVGGPVVLAMLLERVLAAGARPAEAGEFTARAFLRGALGLPEAEAVAALIEARSDAELRRAHRLREQAPIRRFEVWMERLTELVALVEAGIDFAEEPIEFISPAALREQMTALHEELTTLIRRADEAERLDALPTVCLLGPTNAGKSTLLNALTGTERAICSAVEGTTRDILSAPLTLPGLACVLLDGAGLAASADELSHLAQHRTRQTAARADLLCLVLDVSRPPPGDLLDLLPPGTRQPVILVANKADLLKPPVLVERISDLRKHFPGPIVTTSARTGAGLEALRDTIRQRLAPEDAGGGDPAPTLNARRRQALADATAALQRAVEAAEGAENALDQAELLAFELREALEALGSIYGHVTTEDLLGHIFANFCIGK